MSPRLVEEEPSVGDYRRSVSTYDSTARRPTTTSSRCPRRPFSRAVFALVVVCGCFFGLGTAMGHRTAPATPEGSPTRPPLPPAAQQSRLQQRVPGGCNSGGQFRPGCCGRCSIWRPDGHGPACSQLPRHDSAGDEPVRRTAPAAATRCRATGRRCCARNIYRSGHCRLVAGRRQHPADHVAEEGIQHGDYARSRGTNFAARADRCS